MIFSLVLLWLIIIENSHFVLSLAALGLISNFAADFETNKIPLDE